jgi:DnaJ-class molecular chaperone
LKPVLARAKRDHYAVLGVRRDADGAAIKKAFRALASEYHPDVSEDPDAAARFREVVDAYEVLSNPAERRHYDRRWAARPSFTGSAPVSGSDPARVYSPFDDMLRAAAARPVASRPAAGARGADVVVELELEFVEAVRGAPRALRYTVEVECAACRGTGRHLGLCERCVGRGRVQDERVVPVRIPSGSKDGARLRLGGQGHAGGPGGEPGDLTLELRVAAPRDTPALRVIAALGAACALVLAIITLVLYL